MTEFDIMECLVSMSVLIDTREQPTERAIRRYESFGVPYRRQKLEYGDYTFNCMLPDGTELYPEGSKVNPSVMIERKMNLEELSMCLCQDRDRFQAEFQRAIDNNSSIYLLVEDGSWEKIIGGKYNTKFNSNAYFQSLISWMSKYKIQIIFCKKEITGKIIKAILSKELKHRLESGEFG